jgi:hypothetical protein
MAVLHRDGSNCTRDETCPDHSYFHVNAFLGIALICIGVFNDMVVVSFGVVLMLLFWIRDASLDPTLAFGSSPVPCRGHARYPPSTFKAAFNGTTEVE